MQDNATPLGREYSEAGGGGGIAILGTTTVGEGGGGVARAKPSLL